MLSYWEKSSFFSNPDICIVGAGIVGLTTAIFIKQKHPDYKVIVAEKGFLPDGASTKNAGFCCFGSVTELDDDMQKWPKENVLALAEKRFKGLQLLTKLVGTENMNYEPLGGYEVFTHKTDFEKYWNKALELNNYFSSTIGQQVYEDASDEIKTFGFKNVEGIIKNKYEGQIDTGKMMTRLTQLVKEHEITIFYGMNIKSFSDLNNKVQVQCETDVEFYCKNLIITTNGFAAQLLPELDVKPARAQVLITKPIENLKLKGSFHYHKGYYYFRNVGNRVLFGGGRNLDFKTEETYQQGLTPLVQNKLEELLTTVILPDTSYEIDMRWSGTMGVGSEKKTIVKQVSSNVFCGVRMGGMGVALGSLVGKELSNMIS